MAELRFFNPYADIRFTANRLPHWHKMARFISLRSDLSTPFLIAYALNGSQNVSHGYVFIRNLGVPKLSANIMNASQVRSNTGSMLAMVLAFCDDLNAHKQWPKRCTISMASAPPSSHL